MHQTRQSIVLHYGELSLKGKNRPTFIRRLGRNIEQAVSDFGTYELQQLPGRMLLTLWTDVPWACVAERLCSVFGLANFAPCLLAPHDLEAIKKAVSRLLHQRSFASFRVTARRAFRELPWGSDVLQRVIGTHVLATHQTRVNLDHPELTVHVDLIPRKTLVYADKMPGAGGLPVGTGGPLLSLLSGGIDSPVAAHRMMKRGCQVDFVHFHSYPFLDRTSQEKARQLGRLLTRYEYTARLFLVPFGEIQQHIVSTTPPPLRVVLYRRYMMRLANALAQQIGAQALVTGESLGQVASQTLQNLRVIESASALPILRPLIGMDKVEIMAQAHAIGTYKTSILPDQDCCTLFVPRHPATHAALTEIEAAEKALDTTALVQMALDGLRMIGLRFPEAGVPVIEP